VVKIELEVDDLIAQARRDGLLLKKTAKADSSGAVGCWLGGQPRLPSDVPWPFSESNDALNIPSVPLHFIGQIDLSNMPRRTEMAVFPSSGTLFFFFDPAFGACRDFKGGSFRVIYETRNVLACDFREMPAGMLEAVIDFLDTVAHPQIVESYRSAPTAGYPKRNITFVEATTYNAKIDNGAQFRAAVRVKNLEIEDSLDQLAKSAGQESMPKHFVGCGPSSFGELVSGKVVFDHSLIPLFSFSDDLELGVSLGLAEYNIVFWIESKDLADGNFSNVIAFPGI